MKRYHFLNTEDIYEAINRLRDAFLAAKDGSEVEEIINAILTRDEKLRIGRRILISEFLKSGLTVEEIVHLLRVGNNTVMSVAKNFESHDKGFRLIEKRTGRIEKEYQNKKYRKVGGSLQVIKRKEYTGFKRKDVKR